MPDSFHSVIAWQKAHEFVLEVYQDLETFPEYERRGLWSQFTRAAVSIPANIAEGLKKISKAEKIKFLNISQGSLEECRYYILLSKDLHYITEEKYKQLNYKIEGASYFLNSYIDGVLNNTGIQD